MLTAFWNCCCLVYTEFGLDGHKEKRNVTGDTYFDTLMYLKNVIRSKAVYSLATKYSEQIKQTECARTNETNKYFPHLMHLLPL